MSKPRASDFKCPQITVGGVPIISQPFSWCYVPGAQPWRFSLIVPKGPANDALRIMQNPVSIVVKVFGGVSAEATEQVYQFDNVYLLEARERDQFSVTWSLADARFKWQGMKVFCSYNKTRKQNNFVSTINTKTLDPSILRQQFDRFIAGRYLEWSVKSGGSPYTVREIITREFTDYGIDFDSLNSADESYIVENVEYDGVSMYSFLNDLCARARLSIGIRSSGQAYLYSIDYFDYAGVNIAEILNSYPRTGPGIIYRQDMTKIRPAKITVRFEKLIETKLMATACESVDTSAQMIPDPMSGSYYPYELTDMLALACVNVLPVPYPFTYSGKSFDVGEWVPIGYYVKSIPITLADINTYWFSSALDRKISHILSGGSITQDIDLRASTIASTIRSHYRQTYMIDPYYARRIKNWMARKVAVVDNYSHYSSPSPLWADFCVVPKTRHPYSAQSMHLWSADAYNYIVDEQDLYRSKGTAGTISMVDEALGIFKVFYPSLIDQVVDEIIPSACDNLPKGLVGGPGQLVWEQANLKSTFALETLVSVVWEVDKFDHYSGDHSEGNKKYYEVEFDYSGAAFIGASAGVQAGAGQSVNLCQGPNILYLSRLDFARYVANRQYSTEISSVKDAKQGEPVNKGILDTLANCEAAKIMHWFIDRYVGEVTLAGIVPVNLTGNIKSVTYSFSPSAALETKIDMRDIAADLRDEQILPAATLAYIKRQVTLERQGKK